MTLTQDAPAPAATATAPPRSGPGTTPGLWRRHRASLLIGGALVAAVLVAVLLGGGARTTAPMDPGNPGPNGTRALAQVLGDNDVDVDTARSAEELEDHAGRDTTIVVVVPEYLGRSTTRRLLDHASPGTLLVVAGAGPGVTDLLGVAQAPSRVTVQDGREAGCDDPVFSGLTIEVDAAVAYPRGTCFDGDEGALVRQPRPDLVLFGAEQALTNEQVLRADNAAVALRLLGQREHLVWYVPTYQDLVGGDGVSLQTLLPRWVRPGLWVLALTMVAVIWWRARRLGPLAVEPLPVVVRAIETTRSLGRLYRRAGDRSHATTALRRAACTRCAERLRMGSTSPPDVVVREVARRTGRPPDQVAALLDPDAPGPVSDRDLVTLANDLAQLDREVRRT